MTCSPSPPDLSQPVSLFHGDCVDVVAGLPEGCVDLVVTDPPYMIQAGSVKGDTKIAKASNRVFSQYEGFSHGFDMSLLDELERVSRTVNWYFFCNKTQIPDYIRWAEAHRVNWDILTWWKTNAIPLTHGCKRVPDVEYVVFLFKNAPVRGSYKDMGHVLPLRTGRIRRCIIIRLASRSRSCNGWSGFPASRGGLSSTRSWGRVRPASPRSRWDDGSSAWSWMRDFLRRLASGFMTAR
ncbi:DNA methylase [Parascardovia denticolens IPLA 20019]|nr:DNA methylase [Parascardovia denticolens IPLA 20019]